MQFFKFAQNFVYYNQTELLFVKVKPNFLKSNVYPAYKNIYPYTNIEMCKKKF